MHRQLEPVYASLLGTSQQAMEHTYCEELVKGKTTATRAKSPYVKVDALNVNVVFGCD